MRQGKNECVLNIMKTWEHVQTNESWREQKNINTINVIMSYFWWKQPNHVQLQSCIMNQNICQKFLEQDLGKPPFKSSRWCERSSWGHQHHVLHITECVVVPRLCLTHIRRSHFSIWTILSLFSWWFSFDSLSSYWPLRKRVWTLTYWLWNCVTLQKLAVGFRLGSKWIRQGWQKYVALCSKHAAGSAGREILTHAWCTK